MRYSLKNTYMGDSMSRTDLVDHTGSIVPGIGSATDWGVYKTHLGRCRKPSVQQFLALRYGCAVWGVDHWEAKNEANPHKVYQDKLQECLSELDAIDRICELDSTASRWAARWVPAAIDADYSRTPFCGEFCQAFDQAQEIDITEAP